MSNEDYRLSLTEAYRAGYEAGYFWGRIDEARGTSYDTRTPAKRFGDDGQIEMAIEDGTLVCRTDCA